MLRSAVDLELSLGVAGVGAVLAAEGFLSRVGSDVPDSVVPGHKLLEANCTRPTIREDVVVLKQ